MSLSKIKNYSKKVWKSEFSPIGKGGIYLSNFFVDKSILKDHKIDKNFFNFSNEFPLQYVFPDTKSLEEKIQKFHEKEGYEKEKFKIFTADGSTPLLSTLIVFAKALGFNQIHSVFPIYFNIHKICDSLNISIVPVNDRLTHEGNFKLTLPKKKSILLLTDPIWCIGRKQSGGLYEILAKWQSRTKSIIIIDSSFDYTNFKQKNSEKNFIKLNLSNTIRLVSPTKSLGILGSRFAYLIVPKEYSNEINILTCSVIGPTSRYGEDLRIKLFDYFYTQIKNKTPLVNLAKERFEKLRKLLDNKKIKYISPNCCSYILAEIIPYLKKNKKIKKYSYLNHWSIDIPIDEYKNYIKINLLMQEENFQELLNDLK